MEIKTAMRCYYTLIRMAKMEKMLMPCVDKDMKELEIS